jgi:hypothetical protein
MTQHDNRQDFRTYEFTICPRQVTAKPNEFEKRQITRNLRTVTGLTISDFSKYMAPPYSYTWSGGIFDGTRSNATWTLQNIIGLDFDNASGKTITIQEVLSRFKEFGIFPQVWYNTFGASNQLLKYRVVLFLSDAINDRKMHHFIMSALMTLFPEADQSCKDASRYFFGGKESYTIALEPIETSQLIDALSIFTIANDFKRTRKLPLDQEYYSSRKNAPEQELLYNIYRSSTFGATNEMGPEPPTTTSCPGGLIEKFDFEKARKRIRIFDEFLNGTWLYHMQLFGLATNLIHIQGGVKLMKETMEKFNEQGITDYTDNNFAMITYVKNVNYYPQPIYKFSPYSEDEDLLDFISTTKDIRGLIEQTEPIVRLKLSEAEILLKQKFNEVTEHGEVGKVYLFKLPTAIGKTSLLLDQNATIALPTNALKNEVSARMKIPHECTPDSVGFSDEEINNRIDYYHQIGLPKKAMGVIHHMVSPENESRYQANDIRIARRYLNDLQRAINSRDSVLTTHKRALLSSFKHDTLIFDEDPLSSLLNVRELNISDVFKLNLAANVKGLGHIIDYLSNSTPTVIRKTPTFSIDIDKLVEKVSTISVQSNIIDFLGSRYFIRDGYNADIIYYIVQHDLPRDKKIIITSATVPVEVYRKIYGDRIEVIDISDVEQTGQIIQYTSRSCSRKGLGSYVNTISKKVGNLPVITFKSFDRNFMNPVVDMYFGNCSGYDSLKGKDIAVVGTPHRNQVDYLLTASVLGLDIGTTDTTMYSTTQ